MPDKLRSNSTYGIIDLMPDFWLFYAASKDLDVQEQARLFKTMVAEKHAEVYAAKVIWLDETKPYDEAIMARYIAWSERSTTEQINIIKRMSDSIAKNMAEYEEKFRATFSDFSYSGQVYFMHSLMAFDGAVRTINGKSNLLFGLDTMALVYGEDMDLQPFFHHEIFHIYHAQFLEEDANDIAGALWMEGLAQYTAKCLNPNVDGVNLFGLPKDMPERSKAMLPILAGHLLEALESTSPDDYGRFFRGNTNDPLVPARSGYYVAYLVAKKLGQKYSLQEMAHFRLTVIKPEIQKVLEELAEGKKIE